MSRAETWQQVSEETAYRKYSITINRRDFELPDGRVDEFYVRIEPKGVCILALTPGDKEVVTIPQYRPGPRKLLRELPGGRVDDGEDVYQAGKRELLEETGFAGEVDTWVGHWYSDAYTDSDRNIIIVRNCKKIAEQELEANEFGEVELVPVAEFTEQAMTGQLTDTAGALQALGYLGLLGDI
jgi:ADP-ribose pyrophosphatase